MIRALLAQLTAARPPETGGKPVYIRLFKSRFGEWQLQYRTAARQGHLYEIPGGPWTKMCPLNLDQVSWIASDGWPIEMEGGSPP